MQNIVLFEKIKKLVLEERRIGVEILELLYEIEKRKAYCELKYDGLYTYCIKELGFTDSQAYQRIQAMRVLKEIPEIKLMIADGSLSVSSVSKVQTHLRQEKKTGVVQTKAHKLELFQSMQNQTSRQVDLKLAEIKGEKLKTKVVLELDEETAALWKKAKDLSAHQNQGDAEATFKMLLKEWVKRNDPETKNQRAVPLSTWKSIPSRKRYIPTSLRTQVWKRDQGKCVKCGSQHALEVDHRQTFAKNGDHSSTNLRLLCKNCNTYEGIQSFGLQAMRR